MFDEKLKQAKLVTKIDIFDFITKTYFDDKLKNINKRLNSNDLQAKREVKGISKKVPQISMKGYDFLLGKCILQNFLLFSSLFNSLILDNIIKKFLTE